MLSRYNNSKRITALLGVVLALLPSVQDLHLLCHLGGCAATCSAETACSEHSHSEAKSCSHSHACTSAREASVRSPERDCIDDQDKSCPCPPDCWCHQPAQPLQLPKGPSEPIELLLRNLTQSDASIVVAAIGADRTASCDYASTADVWTESAVQRCAELCRFLI